MAGPMLGKLMLGKLLYGLLFVAVLPCMLVLWAASARPNVGLPVYGSPIIGGALAACGLILMCVAMWQLWRFGGGLPMNAFPPPTLVTRGVFRWFPHPIYAGFVALSLGVSMAARSAAGLWLITPSVVLACAALVLGYERLSLQRRFGAIPHQLPADDCAPPSLIECIRFYFAVVIPWLALYAFTVNMGLAGTAFRLRFEDRLPIYPWTTFIYETSYITVALAPWCARTRRDLRRLTISAWVAMAVVFPFYWIVPSSAPRYPLIGTSWLARMLAVERNTYPPCAAFPSFHILWAVFVGRLYRPKWLGIAYAAAIAVSCIATGQHYILDVLGALAIGIACLFFEQRWILLGAHCLGAPWMQALGRLRCLVNGCCHGAPAPPAMGIRVTHARSRVTRLAALAGVPVHPTQLYSILSNALLGLVLLRLWLSACPLSLIIGVYAIGNGMARFVEEAYRGEPQTLVIAGLRLYQWIALGCVLVGALVTTFHAPSAPMLTPSINGLLWASAFASLAAIAMGVDFPESNRPFARLT